jgi:rhodanese-related sulfurtransferase
MLGYIAENMISGLLKTAQWNEIEAFASQGYQLVDVRSASEFAAGSIPGAVNFPVDQIRDRVGELTNRKILVNCQVGQRGHTATLLLNELGFSAVNLDGGYLTWSKSPASKKELITS